MWKDRASLPIFPYRGDLISAVEVGLAIRSTGFIKPRTWIAYGHFTN
jgi:hypothetical protein